MKIYWLWCKEDGFEPRRCFFRICKTQIERDVSSRDEAKTYENPLFRFNDKTEWWFEESNVDENDFGYCTNTKDPYSKRTLDYSCECSVGTIRKMRNEVEIDDGKCGTCPYYFKECPKDDI